MFQNDFSDDVNGTIIGEVKLTGKLFYNGKQQGPTFFHETEQGLKGFAEKYIQNLKKELGEVYPMIYNNGEFELRIY